MTQTTTELTEKEKRDRDMLIFGTGFMKDGKHVPIKNIHFSDLPKGEQKELLAALEELKASLEELNARR